MSFSLIRRSLPTGDGVPVRLQIERDVSIVRMEECEMRKRFNIQPPTGFMALVLVLFLHGSVWGYDLTDKFSIGGILTPELYARTPEFTLNFSTIFVGSIDIRAFRELLPDEVRNPEIIYPETMS